jgi:SDR family mycofactocin-dependent oxidoreductase
VTGRLAGKVAFVTGAARGQGRSHAVALAKEGASIIALDICADIETVPYPGATEKDLTLTADLVTEAGAHILTCVADVRDPAAVEAVVTDGLAEFGRLDIVCANAGILSYGPAEEITPQQWNAVLAVNLTGVWHTARAAIPSMKKQNQGGSIILTSSLAGLRGYQNTAHYVASKHGVVGLMRTLAQELAPWMIRVNSVHPTNVRTPMIENAATYRLTRPDLDEPTIEDAESAFQTLNLLAVPWVEASDVTSAVLWLATDESRFVTGVALPIDAGGSVK